MAAFMAAFVSGFVAGLRRRGSGAGLREDYSRRWTFKEGKRSSMAGLFWA
jgi:hypothetical protein